MICPCFRAVFVSVLVLRFLRFVCRFLFYCCLSSCFLFVFCFLSACVHVLCLFHVFWFVLVCACFLCSCVNLHVFFCLLLLFVFPL